MRVLARLMLAALALFFNASAFAAQAPTFDAAERLALWGYDVRAWEILQARLKPAASGPATALTPHEEAQSAYVQVRFNITALVDARDLLEFIGLVEAEFGNPRGKTAKAERDVAQKKLAAAAAAARSSCKQLQRIAQALPSARRAAWLLRASTSEADIALVLEELPLARTVAQQALAVPGVDTVAERALVHLALAKIAGKERDAPRSEAELNAGLAFLDARGGQQGPYYASLLHEKILLLINAKKFDVAFDAIGQYRVVQRAGPGQTLQAWRELGIANLLYQIGRTDDAERALKAALEGQLLSTDETDAERLSNVAAMLDESEDDPHRNSRVRVATFLLKDDMRVRLGRFPEYRQLLDKLAIVAAQAGDIATMSAVEALRSTAGELSVANDEYARAAVGLIERTDPKKLLATLKKELDIPDPTKEKYFLNIYVLEVAFRKLRDTLGIGAREVEDVVHLIMQEHQSAYRNDLANVQLIQYRTDVLEVQGMEETRRALIFENISHLLRRFNDPKSADDAAELSELATLRGRAKKCQGESDMTARMASCQRYVAQLLEAKRTGDAIEFLLRLHDDIRSNRKRHTSSAFFLAEIADALYDALQYTELGLSRDAFFYVEGKSRRARIPQLCASLIASNSMGSKNGYCAVHFLYGQPPRQNARSLAEERTRLLNWATQSGEISTFATSSSMAPREAIATLQSQAKDARHTLDSRRLALLLAWEMRGRLQPRNETTDSELLLDLAELYATDDGAPLMQAYVEQAFDINRQGGGTTTAFLRRVLRLLIASDTDERPTAPLIARIVDASGSTYAPTGSVTSGEAASVEFLAASNLPPPQALAAIERLAPRLNDDISFLSMKSSPIPLDEFCIVLLRTSGVSGHAPRVYRLLRAVLQNQDRHKVDDPAARSTVLLAALDIAQEAGAGAELPMLVRELKQVRQVGQHRLHGVDRIVSAWDDAMTAAGDLRINQATVSRLTDSSPVDQAYPTYRKAFASAMGARQFDQAELLLNRLLSHALQAKLQHGDAAFINPLRELQFGYSPPCSLANGSLSTTQSLLPGTLQQCGTVMAAWHRNLALYETFESILAKSSDRAMQKAGPATFNLDDFLAWETALANDMASSRAMVTLQAVDFIRSPDAPLSSRPSGASSALARIRAILAGQAGALQKIPEKLRDDEAVVLLHLTKRAMFSWSVTPRGVVFKHWDASRAEIRAAIAGTRRQFYLSEGSTELPAIKLAPLVELYRYLLEPLETELRGVSHLYVVPNGALALVPYGVLVTQVPPQETWPSNATWRPNWLIDRMGVGVLRSLEDFRAKAAMSSESFGKLFLGMGDPLVTSWDDALRFATPCIALLPKLDSAADELNQIAALFGAGASDVLTRDSFTVSKLAAVDWSRYRYLLIASHAVQSDVGGCVSDSGIVTSIEPSASTPPVLTASFVAERRLAADLVVLSACESGIDDLYREDRPVGSIAGAFLQAGARSVIASNWPVVSARANLVTTALFRSLSSMKNADPARALRHAMLALSASPDRHLAHPLVWGSLFLVGSQ